MEKSWGLGTRHSQRIKDRGAVLRHYFAKVDGVVIESSFLQRFEGSAASITHIGALEGKAQQDGGSIHVLVDGPNRGKFFPCWRVKGRRAKCRSISIKANGPFARKNLLALDLNRRSYGPCSAISSSNRPARDDYGLLEECITLNLGQDMTMPKLPAEDVLQRKSHNVVQAPHSVYDKSLFNLLPSQPNREQYVNAGNAERDAMMEGVPVYEDANEPIGNQAQGMLTPCRQESLYSANIMNGARIDQFVRFDAHQIRHPEGREQGANYGQDANVTGCFARAHGESSNHAAFCRGDPGQLKYDPSSGISHLLQYNQPRGFVRMLEEVGMPRPGADWSPLSNGDEQNRGLSKEILMQKDIGSQAGCSAVATSAKEPTTHLQNQFPFSISPQTENWPGYTVATAGPPTAVGSEYNHGQGSAAAWTSHAQYRFPSDAGQCVQGKPVSNVQSDGLFPPQGYGASQLRLQNDNTFPKQWCPTLNLPRGAPYSLHASQGIYPSARLPAELAQTHLDSSSYQVGPFAPNSGGHAPRCMPCNTASVQHSATIIESPSVDSSSLERLTCVDTILPSSLQNLEGLDAHSMTAAGGHLNELPSACSGASKKERLTKTRGRIREGQVNGTGTVKDNILVPELSKGQANGKERLTAVLSEARKNECLPDGEPQQKPKRKKIRAKVQRDESRPRGRRGPRTVKTQGIPQGANVHGQEGLAAQDGKFAETGLSSVGETTSSAIISPLVEGTTKLRQDVYPGYTLIHPQGTNLFEESITAGSGTYKSTLESSYSHQCLNMLADSGTGLDFEKPPLIDYLALSDQQHRAGTKDLAAISSKPESKRLAFFGCQDLVLYDPVHQQPQSKELPLSIFSGETSSTESTGIIPARGSFNGSTDLVPVQGSSSHLSLAKVNPVDNLQLVLYNQKRDIVVSKFRTYKKIRAKVLLDPESQRVWLQLENGAGPKPNDDPNKARHWEKERSDMRKKVELFIKKMHIVQGDRKFSPWKGSIVDSVVGAFLTQNVSDHLSSSAFMSVASRFPPVSKKNTLVPCPDVRDTVSFERPSEVGLRPERFPFSSADELALSKQGDCDGNNGICVYESTNVECDFARPQVPLGDNILQTLPCINNVEGIAPYLNTLISTPDPQTLQQDLICASDDERNSTCAFEKDASNCATLEDISGAFRQHCTGRNSKARRMLSFGPDTKKQQPELCSTLEPDKQVNLALIQTVETASDNISDQLSESESAAGSSGSVHSVQDSNFQLSIVQEGTLEVNIQAKTVQASGRELNVAAEAQIDFKVTKKRPMSLSSISGMERALLEANQKGRKRNHYGDWESVRKQALGLSFGPKESLDSPEPRSSLHEDSVNWDAVQRADLGELADTIKERGMHHVLSGRIKAFLTSVHEEHGSIDLEWLRNLSSEKAREYLMSIHGLGVKSVECIRLLTLHHLAFPVDTNVGRICVRLGWVPIEPLPEEVQLHLVELYPIQETIQKYLWPRLCTLDQRTLYELHYQLITFGKVFCTKSKPNCNACPMRTECRHFSSAYASARPLLTAPETAGPRHRICSGAASERLSILGMEGVKPSLLEYPQDEPLDLCLSMEAPIVSEIDSNTALLYNNQPPPFGSSYKEFIVEEPASPERTLEEDIMDIEDMGKPMYYYNNYSDYSTELLHDNLFVDNGNQLQVSNSIVEGIKSGGINIMPTPSAQFPSLLSKDLCCSPHQSSNTDVASKMPCCKSQSIISCVSTYERCTELVVEVAQNAIVPVPEAAQIPAPKLKSVGRLRTIHYVYELPDDHSLLKMVEVDAREKDDPCCYLLAIWSPGETPESQQEIDELCRDDSSTQTLGKADENVAGTLLIPCRTAMHGSFPLNGTYFQVNEVFADHASSLHPLQVPRSLIWSLRRRFVYFGTSVPNIFKGLSTDEIKDCFWRGHVCVRGFDRKSRAPKPLVCRLHFPISKQPQKAGKGQGRKKEERAGFSSTSYT